MSAVHSYFYKSNSTVRKEERKLVIKVAVADRFRFKMVPSIKNRIYVRLKRGSLYRRGRGVTSTA